MSKKVFMLSTSRCGFCRQAKDMIEKRYPEIDENQFRYFMYDIDNIDDEAAGILDFARNMGVRGVPFTVLLDGNKIVNAVNGYNADVIKKFVEETFSEDIELDDTNGG